MNKKSVIIIGSGIGGLAAGNLLAKKGHRVTIFESHTAPGGYTAGFYRKGFYFESGTLSFEASASVFKAMKDIGVLNQVEFVRQRMGFVSKHLNGAPESYADLKNLFYKAYPADKESLDNFFKEIDRIADAMGKMDKPIPYLLNGLPLLFAILPYILKGKKMMKIMKEYGNMTTSEFLGRYFPKDSKLYRLFFGFGYPDMSATSLNGAFTSMFDDYWTVKSGMQSWADLLVASFKKYGGELKLNSYVDKIITKNGAAVGIVCNKSEYKADYVISASDYKRTILKLLDNQNLIPPDLQKKIKEAPVSTGMFTVYLGLNLPNEKLREYLKVPHTVFFNEDDKCDIYKSNDKDFFSKTEVIFYSPSLVNQEHAPEGKSSLMLQTMVPDQWMENWGRGDKSKYKQLKDQAGKAMIAKAGKLIPGLEKLIEFRDAATPLTYERYTHNSGGATSSWNWNPQNKFYGRSSGVYIDTPVRHLYIGSCWAMQIGGIPGALSAAYQCVKKIR